jgi:hypothetical protein
MSSDDLSEFINSNAGLTNNAISEHALSMLDRTYHSMMDSINQADHENNIFLGEGLTDIIQSSSGDLSDFSQFRMPELAQSISQTVFGDRNLLPSMNFRNNENKYDEERKYERQERKDNRGSGMRLISEIMGGKGVKTAQDIQQGLINVISSAGGKALEGSSLMDSVAMIKDLVGQGGFTQETGILDRIQQGIQDVSDSNFSFNDLASIGSNLAPLEDLDGDGDIDKFDIAFAQTGKELVNEVRLLHPLIAQAHSNPNFMRRKIKKRILAMKTFTIRVIRLIWSNKELRHI